MKTLDEQLENWKELKYRMNNEGMSYCFEQYSSWSEIDNEEFHQLKEKYLETSRRIKLLVDNKVDEIENMIFDEIDYPELEGTIALCNDNVWCDIYHDYSTEQYPAFGGPFTDSISFIDWLKQKYKAPERIKL
jgi:hypothetical protein